MVQKEHHIIISLASNFNQEANLEAARAQLTQLLTEAHFTSAIWTEPINSLRSEPYLNQLCKGTTAFGFNLLNEVLKETEKRQGRTHNEDGIVTLDLDLLQYDDEKFHLRDWTRNYVKDLINEL
jgi:2-amino-4-hydroxy-6-hydroxymethyldihydropteridine diphosphokinase